MTPLRSPIRVLAIVAGVPVFATTGFAQAAGKTPFTPPQAMQQATAAAAAPTQLEFRAFMDAGGGPQFRIVEPAKKTGVWLKVGEKGSEMDVVVKKFDGEKKLEVEFQGRPLTLVLREGKVISGGTAAQMMPAMPAPPPPTNVAPAVTQSVVVNPTPADEARRLEAVAAEVARRRALREQASNSVQNAPPPAPGPSATATQNIAPPPPPGSR
jgi:hypothetical protein